MKSFLIAAIFSPALAFGAVVGNPECQAVGISQDGSSWGAVDCYVVTDDVGIIPVGVVSTPTVRIRANPDGSIPAQDIPAISSAIAIAYTAAYNIRLTEKTDEDQERAKRRVAKASLAGAISVGAVTVPEAGELGLK